MSWSNVVALVLGWGVTSAFLVAMAHVVLPYLRKRSDADTRLEALEAANVALLDRTARLEQFAEAASGGRGLPRLGAMSR